MLFNAASFYFAFSFCRVMNSQRLALFAFAALAVAGCRTRPEQRAAMDSYQEELRRYEQIIYDLEYQNEILTQQNERLKGRTATGGTGADSRNNDPPSLIRPPRPSVPAARPNAAPAPLDPAGDDIDLSPPIIEEDLTPDRPPVGSTNQKPESPPVLKKQPTAEPETPAEMPAEAPLEGPTETPVESPDEPPMGPTSILLPPRQSKSPLPAELQPEELQPEEPQPEEPMPVIDTLPAPVSPHKPLPELLPAPDDKKVSALFIDPQHTRGLDLDRLSGDDGVRVVIEPRNRAGQFVPAAGKVSVVLLDPARQGEAARLGRWEFDADVVNYQLRLSGTRNIPLELPWTGAKPQSSRLTMFVRWETAEGNQVEASREVNVLLPGQVSSRWTPRPAQRRGPLTRQWEVAQAEQAELAAPRGVSPVGFTDEAAASNAATSSVPSAAAGEPLPEWQPHR